MLLARPTVVLLLLLTIRTVFSSQRLEALILRPLDEPGRFGRVTRASACELFSALSTRLYAAPRAADAPLARLRMYVLMRIRAMAA